MALRLRKPVSKVPEVNLVPMMDVLMTVLTFFVIISMDLNGIRVLGLNLPQGVVAGTDAAAVQRAKPLVLGLTVEGQTVIAGEPVDAEQMAEAIRTYFAEHPDGSLMLQADRDLPYREVSQLLAKLRRTGGKRVHLAVE